MRGKIFSMAHFWFHPTKILNAMRFRPNDDPNWIGKTSIWGWILIRRLWRSGRDTTGQPQEIVVFFFSGVEMMGAMAKKTHQ